MRRAVFLDRDGVLLRANIVEGRPYPPANLNELDILPGVVAGCRRLKEAGFLLLVITNQPDVARGKQRREVVESINEFLRSQLPLDDLKVCYHDDQDRCSCRKPLPGMIIEAAEEWQISLPASFMVGDRSKDIEAGRAAGCKTVLIDFHYHEEISSTPDHKAGSFAEACDWILR